MGGGSDSPNPKDQITPQMAEQMKVNAEMWNYFQKEYQPLIEKYADKVTSPADKAAERGKVAGQINAEVMKTVDPSKVSPNPAKTSKTMGEMATMESGAQVSGQGQVRARQLGETQNVINIGRGQETQAMGALDTIAAQSVGMALTQEELKAQEDAATLNAIGSGVGIAGAAIMRGAKGSNATKSKTMDDPYAWGSTQQNG